MILLIDENVPRSVADFLRARGHDVRLVVDVLAAGTPDPLITVAAEQIAAVVVTWNHRDFKKLIARVPTVIENTPIVRAGLISFQCNEAKGRQRIEEEIESIEFEYERVLRRSDDRRLIVVILENQLKFIRR